MEPLNESDPRSIAGYRVLARLGAGGMGQVYLGRSPGGRRVALKVVRPELADDPEFRARFAREVASARAVSGAFTAAVVDADPKAAPPWLATEFVAGPALSALVREHGPLPAWSVRRLAAGLAEALAAVHAAGVVHRDLKPSNVLLDAEGPRLIDFGISRAAETGAGLTRTGVVVGSPGFMSPEQIEGRAVDEPSDVFSLGAVLAFAASGVGPFGEGATPALLYRVVHREPELDQVPEELRPLVADCLRKAPEERPTPEEVLRRAVEGVSSAPDADMGESGWLPSTLTVAVDRLGAVASAEAATPAAPADAATPAEPAARPRPSDPRIAAAVESPAAAASEPPTAPTLRKTRQLGLPAPRTGVNSPWGRPSSLSEPGASRVSWGTASGRPGDPAAAAALPTSVAHTAAARTGDTTPTPVPPFPDAAGRHAARPWWRGRLAAASAVAIVAGGAGIGAALANTGGSDGGHRPASVSSSQPGLPGAATSRSASATPVATDTGNGWYPGGAQTTPTHRHTRSWSPTATASATVLPSPTDASPTAPYSPPSSYSPPPTSDSPSPSPSTSTPTPSPSGSTSSGPTSAASTGPSGGSAPTS